ncbi:hypothetical protein BTHE68_69400 (plasmid) [Burkholderia sp. THE68]|uniref:DUF4148 domain-containing protein n=1 Tax=Burkholderia sp. THE68 TaxID=758782 RepID=UPI001317FD72|nr:DUF4148 domain-containing protein [Burkholderia sp. THE68]BBU33206.1 hypothetical protein BTHE68_69400 [Burkholderia sp. THE68]
MKKLTAALLACAVMVPMLSYAQSSPTVTRAEVETQVAQAEHDGTLHQSKTGYPEGRYSQGYGASSEGSVQSGWVTQPSAQALGQGLYTRH